MPQITSNFILRSKLPNFERDSFANGTAMENVNSSHMDEGHISYNEEDRKHYVFHSTDSNGNPLTEIDRWIPLSAILADEIKDITLTQDIWVVDSISDLTDELATKVGIGKLVYIKDVAQLYVNIYDDSASTQTHDYLTGKTGWFRPICDLPSYMNEKLVEYGYVAKIQNDEGVEYVSLSNEFVKRDEISDFVKRDEISGLSNGYVSKYYWGFDDSDFVTDDGDSNNENLKYYLENNYAKKDTVNTLDEKIIQLMIKINELEQKVADLTPATDVPDNG